MSTIQSKTALYFFFMIMWLNVVGYLSLLTHFSLGKKKESLRAQKKKKKKVDQCYKLNNPNLISARLLYPRSCIFRCEHDKRSSKRMIHVVLIYKRQKV